MVGWQVRRLPVALAAAFASHFACDFIYHFEAFYPLSVLGRWTETRAMFVLFAVLAALGAPLVVWIARRDRQAGWLALYGFVLSWMLFDPSRDRRILWAAVVSLAAYGLARFPDLRRWILCAVAAYLPDLFRHRIAPLQWVHERIHYQLGLDFGDWVSLVVRGRWRIDGNERIYDPCYQVGYALSILFEGAILFEESDFRALGPGLCANPDCNAHRLAARRRLLALGKRTAAAAGGLGLALECRTSLHHPHQYNGNRVSRLWAYLTRSKQEKSALKRRLGAELGKDGRSPGADGRGRGAELLREGAAPVPEAREGAAAAAFFPESGARRGDTDPG